MNKSDAKPGAIVLLAYEANNSRLAGCLMVIEQVHGWGCEGYVPCCGGNIIPCRATWRQMEPTGGIMTDP